MSLKVFLENILKNPQNITEIENYINTLLNTPDGVLELKSLLSNDFQLAFMYLPKIKYLYNSDDFLLFLCNLTVRKTSVFYVKNYFDNLSRQNNISEAIVDLCIENKRYDLLDSIFLKYRDMPRSNQLFSEIKNNIQKMILVFTNFLKDPNPVDIELLSIFYSLVYQDIHSFFEDNIDQFFNACYILYPYDSNTIHNIFELFISKYQELTNLEIIINTLCTKGNTNDMFIIVKIITKAYSYKQVNRSLILTFINKLLETISIEMTEEGTTAALDKSDERSQTIELITLLKPTPAECTNKTYLYQMGILKYRSNDIINQCLALINDVNATEPTEYNIKFDVFLYLIEIKYFIFASMEYLKTPLAFIAAKMTIEYLKANTNFHLKNLQANIFKHNQTLHSTENLIENKINTDVLNSLFYINQHHLDKYTSMLLFYFVKENLTAELELIYNYVSLILNKIELISNIISRGALFDLYILLGKQLNKFDVKLISKIIKDELTEVYHLLLYYIAANIDKIEKEFVLNILQKTAFYEEKTMHIPLSCLIVASYQIGYINKEQVIKINEYIKSEILDYKLKLMNTNTIELSYLTCNIFSQNLVHNFLNKKYARIVIKKMISENINEKILLDVIEKNKKSIEYEYTLHSITILFDL